MSGPKVDYAKLREQEMASLAEARGRRLKVADKIQKMINQIDSCLGGRCGFDVARSPDWTKL